MNEEIKILKPKLEAIINNHQQFLNSISLYDKNSKLIIQIDLFTNNNLSMLNYIYKLLKENLEKVKNNKLDWVTLETDKKIYLLKHLNDSCDIILDLNLISKNKTIINKILEDIQISIKLNN